MQAPSPHRRELARLLRRHWPVVRLETLLAWTAPRLDRWSAQGRRRVGLDIDLGGLTAAVQAGVERQLAARDMRVDADAETRLRLGPAADGRSDSPFHCPDYWRLGTTPLLPALKRFRQRLLALRAAGPLVLCVGLKHHNTPSINYLASALRRHHGMAVCAVFLHEPPPDDIYTEAIDLRGSLGLLWQLLRDLPALPVYVQAHARWAFLGLFVKRVNPGLRVCQEIYDWTGLFVPEASEASFARYGVYTRHEIALSKWAERAAIERLDAVFYKNGGAPIERLLGAAIDRATHLWPAPPRHWMQPVRSRCRAPGGRWRLVYAGQIKGRDNAPRIFGDMYYLPLVRDLTRQPIDVDIYWPVRDGAGALSAEFDEYRAEAADNTHFKLHDGRPTETLIADLNGRYDFGLILYYFDDRLAVGRGHIESALASKLFTYIAAGLPVIVSAEFHYMAGLVRDWGIGLVIERRQVGTLAERLAAIDHAQLRERVAAAQRRYFIEANVPSVLSALLPPSPTSSATLSASR